MFHTILVYLSGASSDAGHLDVAARLADGQDAQLIGLHVVPHFSPGWGLGLDSAYKPLIEVQQRYNTEMLEQADRVRSAFESTLEHHALRQDFRFVFGDIASTIAEHARHADIAVAGPVGPEAAHAPTPRDMPAQVAIAAGRPVLAVPSGAAIESVGDCVLVAWNGSREAARAVGDALPILKRAKRVVVLCVNEGETGQLPSTEIVEYLTRHGVAATLDEMAARTTVDNAMLESAANRKADLIVMGAYGHTRLRELILGGTTREILAFTTLPVLLSH